MPMPRQLTLFRPDGFSPEQMKSFVENIRCKYDCPILILTKYFLKFHLNTWGDAIEWLQSHPAEFYKLCQEYWVKGNAEEKQYVKRQLSLIGMTPEEIL